VKLLGRLADGEAALNFEYGYTAGIADVDFHGQPVSHGGTSISSILAGLGWLFAMPQGIIRWRLNCTKRTVVEVLEADCPGLEETDASEKRIRKIKISNWEGWRACV
jgi:hypothetical protein